jgi:hypothetical protein
MITVMLHSLVKHIKEQIIKKAAHLNGQPHFFKGWVAALCANMASHACDLSGILLEYLHP